MSYGDCLTDQTGLTEFNGRDSVDLLARVIYSEAGGESWAGKQGVCWVVKNRRARNSTEFGGNTFAGVILKQGGFEGMLYSSARCPNLNSSDWTDSLYIAENNTTQDNPIGTCLWFRPNANYASLSRINNGVEQFSGFGSWVNVTEKVVIGNHTFFKVAGY